MEKARITESELVLPSLYLMTLNPQGSISTSELIRLLTQILKPTGIDAEILENRKDTYFFVPEALAGDERELKTPKGTKKIFYLDEPDKGGEDTG